MTVRPVPSFAHLRRLTDRNGLFEHARGTEARREGGYCVDDVARALVVVSRESAFSTDPELAGLGEGYLSFLLAAQAEDGRFRNRRALDGRWEDEPTVEDCWGRALWGLGTAASAAHSWTGSSAALQGFSRGARWRSPWVRATAFAALGAVEVLQVVPDHVEARALLTAAVGQIGRPRPSPSWPWPESRLTYANGLLPEVLIAAGAALDLPAVTADGLHLLGWLLAVETRDDHLSVTPVGGRGVGDDGPCFDQQPIEVAALADACVRAYVVTGDPRWAAGLELAVSWFLGANDTGIALYDPASGGGCDGLERAGRNENQGAESTLAALSTLQQGLRLPVLSR